MNTREEAILYWIIIVLVLIVLFGRKNGILDSLLDVIKYVKQLILNPISIVILFMNLLYLTLIYFWTVRNDLDISIWYIKDYLIVLFFSIYPLAETLKKLNFNQLYREKKAELFGLAAIPLFINSSYTFSVGVEMLLTMMLFFLSVIIAVANSTEETKNVERFFNFFLMVIPLFMIGGAFFQFSQHVKDILTLDFWISFGLEALVWIINIPVIYLAKQMILIEKKIIFSNYKNQIDTYIRYYIKLLIRRVKFWKYRNLKHKLSKYITESKELSAVGGNRIYIKINKSELPNEIIIAIISDAILGRNKLTNLVNQREKYPNVVELVDKNNNLYVLWQDDFIETRFRDNRIDDMETIELLSGIKVRIR